MLKYTWIFSWVITNIKALSDINPFWITFEIEISKSENEAKKNRTIDCK